MRIAPSSAREQASSRNSNLVTASATQYCSLPCLRHRTPLEESYGQSQDSIGRIPRNQMLAAIYDMNVDCRMHPLQQIRSFSGVGPILTAINHQERHLELAKPLMHRRACLCRSRALDLLPRHVSQEVSSHAAAMSQGQTLVRDQRFIVKIGLQ